MKVIKAEWKRYLFEFLSIFIGVTIAFALNNWGEDRRDRKAETKILTEIKNGLELDLEDLRTNVKGHEFGIEACNYFRKLIDNKPVEDRPVKDFYFILLRDFISIQNKSGYESLKSRGLGLVRNDSLRFKIVSLYDFDYEIVEKLEESYSENQFNDNYYKEINDLLSENMVFDSLGQLTAIEQPIDLTDQERKRLLSYFWRMEVNRNYRLTYYRIVENNILELIEDLEKEIRE
jgi:hypothetical protein